jgi:hypothetical protein
MLEEAVRWVIITIIFVFDPLAVLLLIASQYTFEWRRSKDDSGGWLRQYEQARAQRIVDNPGYNIDDPKEDADENSREEDSKEESENAEELRDGQYQESVPPETGNDSVVASEEETIDVANSYIENQEEDLTKKKELESSEELNRLSEQELEDLELDEDYQNAKSQWKEENPGQSLKFYKKLYLDNKIDALPWEAYLSRPLKTKKYMMKEQGVVVTREAEEKPSLEQVEEQKGYIQNEEQTSSSSIWKKIRNSTNE